MTLDCGDFGPRELPVCPKDARPWDALVRLADRLTEIAARHDPPTAEFWVPFRSALDAAAAALPGEATPSERIAAQNASLLLALEAEPHAPDLARRAMALVRTLASTIAPAMGSSEPDPGIESWLGPRASWTERTRPMVPLFHEAVFAFTRVFRLVRTPTSRANFSQLVAIDPGVAVPSRTFGGRDP